MYISVAINFKFQYMLFHLDIGLFNDGLSAGLYVRMKKTWLQIISLERYGKNLYQAILRQSSIWLNEQNKEFLSQDNRSTVVNTYNDLVTPCSSVILQ